MNDEDKGKLWRTFFMPFVLLLLIICFVLCAILEPITRIILYLYINYISYKHKKHMMASGRYLEWRHLKEKLIFGEGTLIFDHVSPDGPVRVWWTRDDLLAKAQTKIPDYIGRYSSIIDGKSFYDDELELLHRQASEYKADYLDYRDGSAKLSRIKASFRNYFVSSSYRIVRLTDKSMATIRLPRTRQLNSVYPLVKSITIISWFDKCLIVSGDVETVFTFRIDPLL
jgi:hypothetical protein